MGALIPLANPSFDGNEIKYVTEALETGWVSKGRFIGEFEKAWEHYFGEHAVACSSGTGALHLALLAAGIGPGDDVIVPDCTFASTAAVVKAVGANVVLADISKVTMSLSVNSVAQCLTERTKAVIFVHLYGMFSDNYGVAEFCRQKKLVLIEDMAEVVGAATIHGDYGCFSLFANKQITTGEGGMVVCKNPDVVRHWRDHGMVRQYYHDIPGLNYRMTNLQAAVGLAQMERFDWFCARRRAIWAQLRRGIPEGKGHWLYIVPKKEMKTVETRPVFDPLHTLPPYEIVPSEELREIMFPNSRRLHRDFMCLPCGPHLTDEQVQTIIAEYNAV